MTLSTRTAPWTMASAQSRRLQNLEGLTDLERDWQWNTGPNSSIATVLRIKNEATNLPFVLPPLFRAVDQVVIIDNQSTDGSAELAIELAAQAGATDRLVFDRYPVDVSRCGSEHRTTPPTSVRSLTYFYNWSFSHATTRYASKWDGDMVLTLAGEHLMTSLAWRLEGIDATASFALYALWVASDDVAYLDVALDNHEIRVWPNRRGVEFVKARDYETLRSMRLPRMHLGPGYCFEIKRVNEDEFDQWTHPDDFNNADGDVPKKPREWAVANALATGSVPDQMVRIDAEPGEHVIDTARRLPLSRWLKLIAPGTDTG